VSTHAVSFCAASLCSVSLCSVSFCAVSLCSVSFCAASCPPVCCVSRCKLSRCKLSCCKHFIIIFPAVSLTVTPWESMLQLGWMHQLPYKLHTCIACYTHVLHVLRMYCILHACIAFYTYVLHVVRMYCMLHIFNACSSVTHTYCMLQCYTCACRLQWEDVTVGQALALTAKPLPSSSEPSHRRSASSSVGGTATHHACCCAPCSKLLELQSLQSHRLQKA